ncbi:MAG TPA: hypothetical protein DCL54_11405 [Alphaproteobacteria bacterium]|nr:hypothetical protein [Alphaproteobacteria bacterium]HAJ47172.1 hypothetical protein [Alphaproteobacteria bacterium]
MDYTALMSRLDSALSGFSQALDALERTVQSRDGTGGNLDLLAQVEQLRADKAALMAEVERLSREHQRLAKLNGHVAGRLDSAIRDIRAVLEPVRA